MEKGMATHSSILAWRIPWTEEPGRLQSIGGSIIICITMNKTSGDAGIPTELFQIL